MLSCFYQAKLDNFGFGLKEKGGERDAPEPKTGDDSERGR